MNQYNSQPLTQTNIKAVYELFKRNEKFFLISLDFFQRGTLQDEGYSPDLTIVLSDPQTKKPIAAFIAVIKKGWVRKNCYLKACTVDEPFRGRGIGSEILMEIMNRAKSKLAWRAGIHYGDSPPRYWQPGVDLRHTDLLFFLKKHKFRPHGMRYNLTYKIPGDFPKPAPEKNGYTITRVTPEEFDDLVQFVKHTFRFGTWSHEAAMSFENDPPTSFIVKDTNEVIVGWAAHSAHFLGSFGPTCVKKTLRGKGLGGELLRWCIWDIQQNGLDTCTILWVVGNTRKFYSKILGAYIHPVFYPMSRRL